MENKVEFFRGANWATISGSFTPEELRDLAATIEEKFKEFKDGNTE